MRSKPTIVLLGFGLLAAASAPAAVDRACHQAQAAEAQQTVPSQTSTQ